MSERKSSVKIAPSLLASDFSCLEREIHKVEEGGADIIHVDVMDGHFVPNLTMGPFIVEAVRRVTDLFIDVHLMIEAPEQYIPPFASAGADNITVHWEVCHDRMDEVLGLLKEHSVRRGLSIKPGTEVSVIADLKGKLDLVLIMSVEPGFGGQKFMPEALDRITAVREIFGDNLEIEVDGGINAENAGAIAAAGADILVAGTAVFKAEDPAAAITAMKQVP